MGRSILLTGSLLLLVLSLGVLLHRWYQSTPYVQTQRLEAARARWESHTFTGYRLHYEIQESGNTPVHTGKQRRSVTSFFRWIENYPRQVAFGCGGLNFECNRPVTYRAQAHYDADLGYPRHITLTRTKHPDWFNPDFWNWLVAQGGWEQCENLLCTTTERTRITIEMVRQDG